MTGQEFQNTENTKDPGAQGWLVSLMPIWQHQQFDHSRNTESLTHWRCPQHFGIEVQATDSERVHPACTVEGLVPTEPHGPGGVALVGFLQQTSFL